ncbi:macro domain-containing protein [Desulfobacterales bacterium HSG17]|nr:macro domain-containing protein [Desulfobacterales bacterium HSG17]
MKRTVYLENGKEFSIETGDLLFTKVDAIVNPANSGLSHGAGIAGDISEQAGPRLDAACEKIINKLGKIQVTQAIPTRAYNLPYKGIIHAVGPRMGNGNEQKLLEKTIRNCLYMADRKVFSSIAFPAISTGIFGVPKQICASSFKNTVPLFLDKSESIRTVILCLLENDYPVFEKIFTDSIREVRKGSAN